jgi:5'-AMP-activated protein kinase regulatory beta subunit
MILRNLCFCFPATELSGSPPGDYAQEIPVRAPGGKQSGPPILPPHLLQVILNKDTPAHVSLSYLLSYSYI